MHRCFCWKPILIGETNNTVQDKNSTSLLINVGEIKILDTDKVIFENNDILYISKKQHDLIDSAWKSYNRFINIE